MMIDFKTSAAWVSRKVRGLVLWRPALMVMGAWFAGQGADIEGHGLIEMAFRVFQWWLAYMCFKTATDKP